MTIFDMYVYISRRHYRCCLLKRVSKVESFEELQINADNVFLFVLPSVHPLLWAYVGDAKVRKLARNCVASTVNCLCGT